MVSKVLALLVRALRVDSRRLPSHVLRLGLLGIVVIVLFYSQLIGFMIGAPGLRFFMGLSWINFVFASLAGCLLFATSITEEKELQTLGLLRMADVGPLALLLGKTVPRLLAVLLILSVQFPFTLLAITLGGVSWPQVQAAFCTLFAHIVLVGTIGVLCSVVFRRSAAAVAVSFLLICGMIFVPSILLGFLSLGSPGPGSGGWTVMIHEWLNIFATQLDEASGARRLGETLSSTFQGPVVGKQVLVNLGAGLAIFGCAWLLFDPCNRTLDASPGRASLWNRLSRKRPPRRAWQLAILGKDFQQFAHGRRGLIGRLVAYGVVIPSVLVLFNIHRLHRVDAEDFGNLAMGLVVFLFLPLELLLLAARIFREETRDRTWPTLMALPLSLPEIAYPKLFGSLLAIVPLLFYLLLGACLAPLTIADMIDNFIEYPYGLMWIAIVLLGVLIVLHFATLYSMMTNTWLGILLALGTGFLLLILTYMAVAAPVFLWMMSQRGMTTGFDEEVYLTIAAVIVGAIYCAIAAAMHYAIASRLRADAQRD
ncbi:MAG: hypothetical protein DWQ34_28050 [Planctomycetota bacterium]|nr:MAG: hypothetical protein DWQ29_16395 [Planctomycetota bacterium]REJ85954.1 MAG: hypothetical protein DWQ34_28050 [Planctomycetota bacterium]REK28496.1 MAG: hypothetical protein DWQ41_05985 [Planctomycetota bacterium]REK29084.1 MAG: hypothetical protein DWQ45_23345 [Planctomycetota bacterium]